MKKAVWLRPEAVAQIEFLEWTEGDRLRHSKFVGLRQDKNPRSVVKEKAAEPLKYFELAVIRPQFSQINAQPRKNSITDLPQFIKRGNERACQVGVCHGAGIFLVFTQRFTSSSC